jgi:peptide/nickel transport system permease protein
MIGYTIRRLLLGIPVLVAASIFVFVLVTLAGDPLDNMKSKYPRPPQSVIDQEAHRLHLDESWPERYWFWCKGIVQGDFGPSTRASIDIGSELFSRTIITMRLVFFAMLLAVILAIVAGVVSAVKQYSKVDYTFTFFGFLALSIPTFWFAILLKEAAIKYNQATGTMTFYTIGAKDYNYDTFTTWGKITDVFGHMILPTLSLMLLSYASWSRFQRASMLDVLNSDYVRLARSKGLRNRTVMVRHALRTALIPIVTVTALDIGGIFGGAVVTETVYGWEGMGRFLIVSVQNRDVYAVLGWLLIAGFIVVVFNIIADLLYAALDPRIRYD